MRAGHWGRWFRERVPDREILAQRWRQGSAVFGRPDWFREKASGWGVTPVKWQGWAYAAAWSLVIAVPFAMLLVHQGGVEALIWMFASGAALVWDVRQVRRILRTSGQDDDVLYIGDDGADGVATTRHFRMCWQRPERRPRR